MTPDIDTIRAALAAAARHDDSSKAYTAENSIKMNAPTWLAALSDEVDLLRNTLKTANFAYIRLEVERDAALTENERLRKADTWLSDKAEAERDAALAHSFELADAWRTAVAENERLRAENAELRQSLEASET